MPREYCTSAMDQFLFLVPLHLKRKCRKKNGKAHHQQGHHQKKRQQHVAALFPVPAAPRRRLTRGLNSNPYARNYLMTKLLNSKISLALCQRECSAADRCRPHS